MICHVVLFRLRADLGRADRDALVRAFEVALRDIPTVRGCRVGRRITFGAGYEVNAPAAEYAAMIDFDDLGALQEYLRHPAHAELGGRFNASIEFGWVYDYEMEEAALRPLPPDGKVRHNEYTIRVWDPISG